MNEMYEHNILDQVNHHPTLESRDVINVSWSYEPIISDISSKTTSEYITRETRRCRYELS